MTETARPEELLTRVGLFAALGRVELAKLAAYLDPVELAAGGEVFRQGETGDSLYVVADGDAGRVRGRAPTAGARCAWARLTPGDLFGEMALFTGEPRSATIVPTARARSCSCRATASSPWSVREPDHLAHHRRHAQPAAALGQRRRGSSTPASWPAAIERGAAPAAGRRGATPCSRRACSTPPRGRRCRRAVRRRGRGGRRRPRRAGRRRQRGPAPPCARCASGSSASSAATALAARAEALAARLAAAGLWRDALGVLARALDAGRLRARRWPARCARSPRSTTDHALRWIERVDDEHASRRRRPGPGARGCCTRSRGDAAPRARPSCAAPSACALVAGDQATGPRLSAEIARLSNSRPPTRRPRATRAPPSPRRAGAAPALLQRGRRRPLRR